MKGLMLTPCTMRPSSARILTAEASVATSSLPSPGTYSQEALLPRGNCWM